MYLPVWTNGLIGMGLKRFLTQLQAVSDKASDSCVDEAAHSNKCKSKVCHFRYNRNGLHSEKLKWLTVSSSTKANGKAMLNFDDDLPQG